MTRLAYLALASLLFGAGCMSDMDDTSQMPEDPEADAIAEPTTGY